MNRTIKFRAWDVPTKTMSPVSELFWSAKGLRANGPSYHLGVQGNDLVEDSNIVLMQFTGLTDKNGKEIYEGDILKLDSWNPANVQVVFIEGAFCLADKEGHYTGDIHYIQHADIAQASVIGNIHENLELIK
jgi:uncharacterized phage protein (TIGR01671 family)